jgi:outer membrane lipoprotein-sorting protein
MGYKLLRNKFLLKKTLSFILFCVALTASAYSGPPNPETVKKVEAYLNGIKTYRATIHQTSDTGERRTGRIYMLRDGKKTYGKLRIEYAPPVQDLFIVDGERCKFYDAQAKEMRDFSVEDTPASFLLARRIDLRGNLKVVDQVNLPDGSLRLKVVRSGDESGSHLILKFSTKPFLKLNGWSVRDPQGITQEVHLENVEIGASLSPDLFQFKPSKRK